MSKAVSAVRKAQMKKLRAHAGHLLDEFIALREKYSLLQPMTFDDDLRNRVMADGTRIDGFKMLRRTLIMLCLQDIAKLSLDQCSSCSSCTSCTSLANRADALADDPVRDHLRKEFAKKMQPTPVALCRVQGRRTLGFFGGRDSPGTASMLS